MKLTKRGKRLRALILTALILCVFAWLNNATTPESCRVPVEYMSQGCLDLLYPH